MQAPSKPPKVEAKNLWAKQACEHLHELIAEEYEEDTPPTKAAIQLAERLLCEVPVSVRPSIALPSDGNITVTWGDYQANFFRDIEKFFHGTQAIYRNTFNNCLSTISA